MLTASTLKQKVLNLVEPVRGQLSSIHLPLIINQRLTERKDGDTFHTSQALTCTMSHFELVGGRGRLTYFSNQTDRQKYSILREVFTH